MSGTIRNPSGAKDQLGHLGPGIIQVQIVRVLVVQVQVIWVVRFQAVRIIRVGLLRSDTKFKLNRTRMTHYNSAKSSPIELKFCV